LRGRLKWRSRLPFARSSASKNEPAAQLAVEIAVMPANNENIEDKTSKRESDSTPLDPALTGEDRRGPENTASHIYEKDKDPDERALGSEGGTKGQMPNYDELRKE
jgi:hypothetical protein